MKLFLFFIIVFFVACQNSSSNNSENSDVEIYQSCLNKMSGQLASKNPNAPSNLNKMMAEEGCKPVKKECTKNPTGDLCMAYKKEFS